MEWKYDSYWSLRQYSPRKEQIDIINEVTNVWDSYDNIIIEAGTGTGKSAIATTLARMINNSYICTMTNQLQSQYLDDFAYMLTEIKGRGNYPCNYGGDCSDCQMENENEKKCNDCEYLIALREAQQSSTVITNYDYLYYAGNYAQLFPQRELLILDETHNLEKKIMSLISGNLNQNTILKRYGFDIFDVIKKGGTLESIRNTEYWINILKKLIEKEYDQIPITKKDMKKKDNLLGKYNSMISNISDEGWIVELPKKKDILDNKPHLKVEFKPLTIKDYSNSLLDFGEKRLFLTGTLGNPYKFCEWIGIDPEDTYYRYVKSPFAVENRPIYRKYVGSMSKGQWENEESITMIKKIIHEHFGEKGVIHTSSNQQAWWIKKHLNSKTVWVAQGETREATIKAFEKSNKPLVLIGAGIKDGVDFKGDKCRFQIIFKMPYPNLGSSQVNIRRRKDPTWYNYQTIMPLMQSYGRGIRDNDDYCTTYVLDSDFEKLLLNYRDLFNMYFLEAIV